MKTLEQEIAKLRAGHEKEEEKIRREYEIRERLDPDNFGGHEPEYVHFVDNRNDLPWICYEVRTVEVTEDVPGWPKGYQMQYGRRANWLVNKADRQSGMFIMVRDAAVEDYVPADSITRTREFPARYNVFGDMV